MVYLKPLQPLQPVKSTCKYRPEIVKYGDGRPSTRRTRKKNSRVRTYHIIRRMVYETKPYWPAFTHTRYAGVFVQSALGGFRGNFRENFLNIPSKLSTPENFRVLGIASTVIFALPRICSFILAANSQHLIYMICFTIRRVHASVQCVKMRKRLIFVGQTIHTCGQFRQFFL